MKQSIITIAVATALLAGTAGQLFAEEIPERARTVGINPIGLALNGLSFVEYTHPISPQASLVTRLDFLQWDEEEYEYEGYTDANSTTYHETGAGPGVGIGIRYFLPISSAVELEVMTGMDIILTSWNWTQRSRDTYGYPSYSDSGDGATTAFAFHAGFGSRIMAGRSGFFVEPQVLFGSLSMSVESSNGYDLAGTGFFMGGALVLGMQM